MSKRQRLRLIFESTVASTPEEKKAACQEAIDHLVTYFGLDEQAASQFILEQELPHALAHDGPGQIVLRSDIANPRGVYFLSTDLSIGKDLTGKYRTGLFWRPKGR